MKLTVIYDNESLRDDLAADWGFACLVEAHGRTILFDTGARGELLLGNMEALGIEPARIDEVVISHGHWDHVGGLEALLKVHGCPVVLPRGCAAPRGAAEVRRAAKQLQLAGGIWSTGTLRGGEQSLVVAVAGGVAAVAGCAHPGVAAILQAARRVGPPRALIGGLHGFSDLEQLAPLDLVCPLHCTRRKEEIAARYPDRAVRGGAGLVLSLD